MSRLHRAELSKGPGKAPDARAAPRARHRGPSLPRRFRRLPEVSAGSSHVWSSGASLVGQGLPMGAYAESAGGPPDGWYPHAGGRHIITCDGECFFAFARRSASPRGFVSLRRGEHRTAEFDMSIIRAGAGPGSGEVSSGRRAFAAERKKNAGNNEEKCSKRLSKPKSNTTSMWRHWRL